MNAHRRRLIQWSGLSLFVGAVGLILGIFLDLPRFFFSYLTAWAFYVSTAIGALILVMMGHASRARWFAPLRRLSEYMAATIPLFLLLAIPIFFGMDTLYGWAGSLEGLTEPQREIVKHKEVWMNVPFFIIRTILYLLILGAFSFFLVRGSLAEDSGFSEMRKRRLQRVGSGGIPVAAFVLTWASFDWLMSLDPTWYSTVFGIYFWAGGFVGALAVLCILTTTFHRLGLIPPEVGIYHQWATGRLLLAFVIFWAYQGFSQLLVIWIGNLPHEVMFYQHRANAGWGWVSFLLAMGQFLIPFLLLLSRDLKKRPVALAWVSAWLLFAHYVDIYWMVMPNYTPHGLVVHWLDLAGLLAVGGALGLFLAFRFKGHATVPAQDPYYLQSLSYRGMV